MVHVLTNNTNSKMQHFKHQQRSSAFVHVKLRSTSEEGHAPWSARNPQTAKTEQTEYTFRFASALSVVFCTSSDMTNIFLQRFCSKIARKVEIRIIFAHFRQIFTPQNYPMQNGRQHVTLRKISRYNK